MKRKLARGAPSDPRFNRYVDFHLGLPHRHYIGYVARGVGLYPLVGKSAKPGDAAICGSAKLLINRYRAVLDGLHAAGNLSLVAAHTLGNCRPAITQIRPTTRLCGAVNLCPHCWTRRAVGFWSRMDAALFPPVEGRRAGAATHDLVQVMRRYGREELAVYGSPPSIVSALISERTSRTAAPGPDRLLGSRGREWRQWQDRFRCAWSVEAMVVDIVHAGPSRGVSVEIRQLVAVPPGGPFEAASGKVRRLATPSRLEVARAAVRLGRYPSGLLIDSSSPSLLKPAGAGLVSRYHDAVFKRRLWTASGDLPATGLAPDLVVDSPPA